MGAKFWHRRKNAPEKDQLNLDPDRMPQHIAIIMDGNGRWATAKGQLRTAGHIAGARTVRKIVEAAPDCGIGTLTLYACLLYTSPSPRDRQKSRMPSSA